MNVSVELFAFLEKYYPDRNGSKKVVLTSGATVATLIKKLEIPSYLRLLFLVNGQQADKGTILQDNDEVFIFSPAEGG
jgi:molybdopterin converting factor small subunit